MSERNPLKEAGFYQSAEDVAAVATDVVHDWEPLAVRYLDQAPVVVASPGWLEDLLDEKAGNICQSVIRTDGEWFWRGDLGYYLRKYHVQLPDEFVSHMAAGDWVVPELGSEAMVEVGEVLWTQLGGPSEEE